VNKRSTFVLADWSLLSASDFALRATTQKDDGIIRLNKMDDTILLLIRLLNQIGAKGAPGIVKFLLEAV